MTYPLAHDDDGLIRFEAAREALEKLLKKADVLAIGPGLGQSDDLRRLVRWVVESVEIPTVLDADGLNALTGQADLFRKLKRPLVITPHPGEFARLCGKSVAEVQADREGQAAALASVSDSLVVVLKGTGSVVTDGRRVYVNTTGNPGMATGGVGDVLTGDRRPCSARSCRPSGRALLCLCARPRRRDIARDQNGEVGMIAGDLVDALPDAFYHLQA